MNIAFEEYIFEDMRKVVPNPAYIFEFQRVFYRKFPQFNDQTKIMMVPYREVITAEWPSNAALPQPVYVIRAGLRAWLNRQRGRIHQWLLNHRYHPADRPSNWHPQVIWWGYTWVETNTSLPTMMQKILKLEWFGMNFGTMLDYGGGERYRPITYAFCCAYDGANDTLYIKE